MNQKQYIKEFEKVLSSMLSIVIQKNKDYAWNENINAFKNLQLVDKLGIITTEQWILTRMTDKFSRIITLLHQENNVKDEKIEDTLIDLANYSIILLLYIKEYKLCQKNTWQA